MHGNVFHELLKLLATRDEVSFTVQLDEHADFSAHVNVRTDNTFSGDTTFALLRGRQTTLAQNVDSLLFIAACFDECILALHHSRSGLLPKLLHCCCCNFSHDYQFLRVLRLFVFNEKRSPADVRLKAALTDE